MFIDKAKIFITAGRGGDGCVSFRREKHVALGGPSGGNGGKGGDVYLEADPHKTTLLDLTYKPKYEAPNGENGYIKEQYGKYGADLIIKVPVGTLVYKNGDLFADLKTPGEKVLTATGGRGGRGNASFKTHRNTAPRVAEKGEPGETCELSFELRLIADVGLVGLPNAGKSTFLSVVSAAKPKIADYPFTTLAPNLGVVNYKDKQFVMADIPGVIEGASYGKGLGLEFLRHIKRTKVLVHIIDISGFDNKSAYEDYKTINAELKQYSKQLLKKHIIIVLNKIDVSGADKKIKEFRKKVKNKTIYEMSAVTGKGVAQVLAEIVKKLKNPVKEQEEYETVPVKKYIYEPDFKITIDETGIFVVSGRKVDKLVEMTQFREEESLRRFQNIIKKMGVEEELIKKGIKEGDTVRVGSFVFDFYR
jgi:GTP-binding protein